MSIDLQSLTPPPFNPAVLKSARAKFRHSLDDLVDFSKIAKSSLEKIESGTKVPTTKQISLFAKLYSLQEYEFFNESVPDFPEVPVDFRDGGSIGPNLLKIINEANTKSSQLLKIVSILEKPRSKLSNLSASSIKELTSEAYISDVRKALKFNAEDILKLNTSKKRALSNFLFRYRVEAVGASISHISFSLSCLLYTSPSPRDRG